MSSSTHALPRRADRTADESRRALAEVWLLSGRMERAHAELAEKVVDARQRAHDGRGRSSELAPRRSKG